MGHFGMGQWGGDGFGMRLIQLRHASHLQAAAIAQDCGPVPQSFGDKQSI